MSEAFKVALAILAATVFGSLSNDTLTGSVVNTFFPSGLGQDDISGGSSSDFLSAGSGNDILNGDAGRDILLGGTGNDTLTGGPGNDIFLWLNGDEGTIAVSAIDTVTDFRVDERIDLSNPLLGESVTNLEDYLRVDFDGVDSTILISNQGTLPSMNQIIIVNDVDLTTGGVTQSETLAALVDSRVLVIDN